jgi:gliding-associated putative ABC transporter substrate-binding component GldG
MKSNRTQTLSRAALVLGILVLVNFISVRIFTRFDLTAQKVYTLSEASKALVKHLDDRITVKAYFTEDLPAPYNNNRRATLDILNEYRAYAGGNLHFEFINPEGEKGEEETRKQGIPPVEVQVVNNDKLEVKRANLGLVLLYEDRKETLPVVQNLSSLEYDLSSAIKRLTQRSKKRIGYTTGHGEPALTQLQRANQELSQQYEMTTVDLAAANASVPDDLAALLVISPTTKFADTAQYALDQYVMRGGKVAFLLNKMSANLNSQYRFAQPVDLGLEDLLENYGLRINGDLVRDKQCANISVVQQQGPFQIQSQVPFVLLPNVSDFNKSNAIVKDLQNLIFYFVSSVDTSLASGKGLRAEVLARSSKGSGRQIGFAMIDPFQKPQAGDFAESRIPLAALVEGSFKSYFTGKPMAPTVSTSPETRIQLVGDGDFMKDEFLSNKSNLTFFQNIADYLADDAGLITIRSKNVNVPPLEQIDDGAKKLWKYLNLFAPPLLIIGYGLFRWRRRISLRKSLEAAL